MISSAYLAYCGPLNFDERKIFLDYCVSSAKDVGLATNSFLCSKLEVAKFLHGEVEISKMEYFNLPYCDDEIDNAFFIFNESLLRNWILISDPTRRAVSWLTRYLVHYKPVVIAYSDIHSNLETCLSSGQCVIVTECDIAHLARDETMRQVLFKVF